MREYLSLYKKTWDQTGRNSNARIGKDDASYENKGNWDERAKRDQMSKEELRNIKKDRLHNHSIMMGETPPPKQPIDKAYSIASIKACIPTPLDLDKLNYNSWSSLFHRFCKTYEVHHHLDTRPTTITSTADPLHDSNDSLVVMWIYSTISPKLLEMIVDVDSTAHEKAPTIDELRSLMLIEESDMSQPSNGNSLFHNTSSSPTVLIASTTNIDKANTMSTSVPSPALSEATMLPQAFQTMTLQEPNWNMDTRASSHLAENTGKNKNIDRFMEKLWARLYGDAKAEETRKKQ
ncbi:hypothetical protein Tco_0772505, partial [Tanacetum coccineum]